MLSYSIESVKTQGRRMPGGTRENPNTAYIVIKVHDTDGAGVSRPNDGMKFVVETPIPGNGNGSASRGLAVEKLDRAGAVKSLTPDDLWLIRLIGSGYSRQLGRITDVDRQVQDHTIDSDGPFSYDVRLVTKSGRVIRDDSIDVTAEREKDGYIETHVTVDATNRTIIDPAVAAAMSGLERLPHPDAAVIRGTGEERQSLTQLIGQDTRVLCFGGPNGFITGRDPLAVPGSISGAFHTR